MRVKQTTVGIVLVLTGLAQIAPGIRPVDGARSWLFPGLSAATTGWFAGILLIVSLLGFVYAGLDLLGLVPWHVRWRPMATVSLVCSATLLAVYWPVYATVAALLDVASAVLIVRWREPSAEEVAARQASHARQRRSVGARAARVAAAVLFAWLAAASFFRPWYIRWGSTERLERLHVAAADTVSPEPSFQTTRAIEIAAPASKVWNWLAEVGQDRAGYYSYDWIERIAGFHVRNAYTLLPQWQQRAVGDFVPAAPPTGFGGLFGSKVGFRVAVFVPSQLYVLNSRILCWSFILQPVDSAHTRLVVRARGNATPGIKNYALSLVDFFALGPAHFIMEHKMMLTLKSRAEAGP